MLLGFINMNRINIIFNYIELDVDTNGSGGTFHSTELLKLKISKIGTLKMGKHIKFRAVASKNCKERRNAKRIGSWCINVKNDESLLFQGRILSRDYMLMNAW